MDRKPSDTEIARELEAQGQRWHVVPRDGAWREVTLERSVAEGAIMWVECGCGKCEYIPAVELLHRTGVDPKTPLLGLAMRCTACGTKRVQVRHRPYSFHRD